MCFCVTLRCDESQKTEFFDFPKSPKLDFSQTGSGRSKRKKRFLRFLKNIHFVCFSWHTLVCHFTKNEFFVTPKKCFFGCCRNTLWCVEKRKTFFSFFAKNAKLHFLFNCLWQLKFVKSEIRTLKKVPNWHF